MGGATIWPVPRAIDAEAHYYPRRWKRNLFFLYGGMFLIGIQVQRYAQLCRVSCRYKENRAAILGFITNLLFLSASNLRCGRESTWTGAAATLLRESASTETSDHNWHTAHANPRLNDETDAHARTNHLDSLFKTTTNS